MNNILVKIGEFSGVLGDFRSTVSKAINEINKGKDGIELAKIAQDTRNKELNAREIEIKKIEDIVALKEEAKKLMAIQAETDKRLIKERQLLDAYIIEQKSILAEQAAKNEEQRKNNEAESKALIKTREDLEKEKTEYKYNFIKGLVQSSNQG